MPKHRVPKSYLVNVIPAGCCCCLNWVQFNSVQFYVYSAKSQQKLSPGTSDGWYWPFHLNISSYLESLTVLHFQLCRRFFAILDRLWGVIVGLNQRLISLSNGSIFRMFFKMFIFPFIQFFSCHYCKKLLRPILYFCF